MPLDPSDLATLSRLLDQGLDLPPAEVDAWLAALPQEHGRLLPRLREMLAEHACPAHVRFMSDGPRLDEDAADGTLAGPGDLIGQYRLIREIGRGGMGAVWLAERADRSMRRHIALKLPMLAWGAGLGERMAREREIGSLLEHPNIARLYDAGVDVRGRPYLALEYIDGQPMDVWCRANALDVRDRLRLFLQVARAVAYAHGRLVVHRDLKPSNVLVTADGQTHLLDFGIAKLLDEASRGGQRLTQELGRALTPHYASPEQLKGETITIASDVYSLGVLLYEILTGRYPHEPERNSLAALEEAVVHGEPAPASTRAQDKATARALRGELDAILAKSLRREPDQRYATADAMAEDIGRYLDGMTVHARPDTVAYRLSKAVRRHRAGIAAASAVLLAVLAGAVVSVMQAIRASDSAERARVVKEFVVDVFRINSPGGAAQGELRQLPAELLLERGGKLIETRFAGQPMLQAELYGVVGAIFSDMGASELAVDYATRQVGALAAVHGSRNEQGRATLLLARALNNAGRFRDAEVSAYRAVMLLEGDRVREPEARVLLARVLTQTSKVPQAMQVLEEADSEISRLGAAPTTARAIAKALRGEILGNRGRFDEALPLYSSAIEDAVAVEGAESATAIDIRIQLANELISNSRASESSPLQASVLAALRRRGRTGEIRAAMEEAYFTFRLAAWGEMSRPDAQAVVQRDLDLLSGLEPGVPPTIRARIDLYLGRIYLQEGDVRRGDAAVASSAAILRPYTQGPALQEVLAGTQGWAAQLAGRHAQASTFLRERIETCKGWFGANSPWMGMPYVHYADNLTMDQRFEEAEAFLRSLPRLDEVQTGTTSSPFYSEELEFALARTRLGRGDPTYAVSQKLVNAAQRSDAGDRRILIGEALCSAGRRGEGLDTLRAGIAARVEGGIHRDAPDVARARAVVGLCALASGDRRQALDMATLAREAFIAQPDVSPYFKRPSEELDRSLGVATQPH
jgi:tetratricopeptide (TPR) repeat protein